MGGLLSGEYVANVRVSVAFPDSGVIEVREGVLLHVPRGDVEGQHDKSGTFMAF